MNVEIGKSGTENSMHVIRKFSRRVQSYGLIPYMRKRRYWDRPLSAAKKKQSALHRIEKAAERDQLIKDGKMSEAPQRTHRRRPSFPTTTSTSSNSTSAQSSSTTTSTETKAEEKKSEE